MEVAGDVDLRVVAGPDVLPLQLENQGLQAQGARNHARQHYCRLPITHFIDGTNNVNRQLNLATLNIHILERAVAVIVALILFSITAMQYLQRA